jgi:signal transduction histidine kinase/DNA-binding NarL/FixJ family response regulator
MADLSTLPDLLPWPFLVCNRHGKVLFANELVSRILGRRIKAGIHVDNLFLELDDGRAASALLFSAARWSAWNGVFEIRDPQHIREVKSVRVILQPDPKHADQVWLIFADDAQVNGTALLTPRAEMSLARTLIDNSPDFIILRDLGGRILHTSRSLDEFVRLAHRGAAADLRLEDILEAGTARLFAALDAEVIQTGQSVRHAGLDFANRHGQSHRSSVVHERIKGGNGLPAGLLTFVSNITDSTNEQNRLRIALEKAQELGAAKSQFVANITHEIRNPINAIQGLCETALESPGHSAEETLRKIQRCAVDLAEMVKDVLDFARLDRGNVTIERIPFNPIRATEETMAQFHQQARRKGVEFAALITPDAPTSVLGDPVKFRRILSNLIGNAVKFTEHGHVHCALEFEPRGDKLRARIVVQDTGIGIPPNRLENIFSPFTQADASTTRRFGGTGLGLTIVRNLAEAMEGYVKVASDPGQGSRFTAALMLAPDPADKPRALPSLREERILIAGGSQELRRWIQGCLQHRGAEAHEVETNEQADQAWQAAIGAGLPYSRALLDLPDDISPKLPAIPRDQLILLTSPDLELRGFKQLHKPLTLTSLWSMLGHTQPTEETPPNASALAAPRRLLRILVAEDNEVNREVTVSRLKRAGHEVSATVDGAAALELWGIKEFDLAVLDIQMPLVDGIGVAEGIRSAEFQTGRRRTRLLALTAMTQESDRVRCEQAGFDGYLSKPMRGSELLAKIDQLAGEVDAEAEADEFQTALGQSDAEEAEDLRCAARSFLRHGPAMVADLELALGQGDPETVMRQAHGIKGMLALMGCIELSRVAAQLERTPALPPAAETCQRLIGGLRTLLKSLSSEAELTPHAQTEDQAGDQD